MWETLNCKTAEKDFMRGNWNRCSHCPSLQPLAKAQSLGLTGGGLTPDLLSGFAEQIEEASCALCLQLKMKHDNISKWKITGAKNPVTAGARARCLGVLPSPHQDGPGAPLS